MLAETMKGHSMKAHIALGAFILFTSSAFAVDLPGGNRTLEPAWTPPSILSSTPAMRWSGLYVGGTAGYQALLSENPQIHGFELGARLGYDQQFDGIVSGVILDIDASFATGNVADYKVNTPLKIGGYARLGYEIASATLVYGLAGFTLVDMRVRTGAGNPPSSAAGFSAGAGIEHNVARNWSVFGEARFHNLWTDTNIIIRTLEAKVGVNYRFGASDPLLMQA
jgi:outer membrane immunogenic protein